MYGEGGAKNFRLCDTERGSSTLLLSLPLELGRSAGLLPPRVVCNASLSFAVSSATDEAAATLLELRRRTTPTGGKEGDLSGKEFVRVPFSLLSPFSFVDNEERIHHLSLLRRDQRCLPSFPPLSSLHNIYPPSPAEKVMLCASFPFPALSVAPPPLLLSPSRSLSGNVHARKRPLLIFPFSRTLT